MYLQDAKREMLKYKSNLLRPASLNTRGEYKHTFTYSLCNMNLIISVIDSLMSAGSVCRRRKKKKRQLYFQIFNSGKSSYSAFRRSLAPQLEDFNEGKHLPYLAGGSEAREVKWFYLVASGKLQKHNPSSLGLNKWYIKQHLEEQWVGRRIHWSR